MVSQRRIRLAVVALAVIVLLLVYRGARSSASDGTVEEFYRKTVSALEEADAAREARRRRLRSGGGGGTYPHAPRRPLAIPDWDADSDDDIDVDADDEELAQDTAKENAQLKAPLRPESPGEVVGVGSSSEGQTGGGGGGGGGGGRQRVAGKEWTGVEEEDGEGEGGVVEDESEESEEEHAAEVELNAILKRAPVIIFSKTWCPHSKRAKKILLTKYAIDPEPLVVELDVHPLGAALQALLADKTHHTTVPNVLVSGVSIGGGDDVAALDEAGTLEATLEKLAGTRVAVARVVV